MTLNFGKILTEIEEIPSSRLKDKNRDRQNIISTLGLLQQRGIKVIKNNNSNIGTALLKYHVSQCYILKCNYQDNCSEVHKTYR